MRIPSKLQDKMKLALGLSLACNLQSLPELGAQAASPQSNKETTKKAEKPSAPAAPIEEEKARQVEENAKFKAKHGASPKDPCPACGRG